MDHRKKKLITADGGNNTENFADGRDLRTSRRSPDYGADRIYNRSWNTRYRGSSPPPRLHRRRSGSRSLSNYRRYSRRRSPSSISDEAEEGETSGGYVRDRRRRRYSRSRSSRRRSLTPRRDETYRRRVSDDDYHHDNDESYKSDRRRRGRRSEHYHDGELSPLSRIERQLERPIKVVVIRNVPLEMTENEIESAVRNAAISLGFSVPNLVKVLSTPENRTAVISGTGSSLPGDRELNTTSAFVDFPSTEAAQVFVDACRRNFVIQNGKKVRLEMARPYVGGLSTITTPDAKLEWVCCLCQQVNRPGTPQCLRCRTPRLQDSPTVAPSQYTEQLGPNLPLPSMDTFVMDRKSGMFYDEGAGLYFDPQTQQFISLTGIYYMKGACPHAVLVPVSRMDAPGLLGVQQQPSNPQLTLPWVEKPLDQAGGNDELLSSGESRDVVDASTSKASAVASVLAAAQYAAKQTKKTKTKTTTLAAADVEGTELAAGVVTDAKYRTATEQGPAMAPAQVPNVQSIFDDTTAEDEETRSSTVKKETSEAAVLETATQSIPAVETGDGGHRQYICFLCLRQFNTGQQLATHEVNSQLHKRNTELQCLETRT